MQPLRIVEHDSDGDETGSDDSMSHDEDGEARATEVFARMLQCRVPVRLL